MAPRKKSGKQVEDEDSATNENPTTASEISPADQVNGGGDAEPSEGGLLAALKKNKSKRAKKGKPVDSFVEGEDPPAADEGGWTSSFDDKAPAVANFDEEDVFSGAATKGKSGKKAVERLADGLVDANKDEEGGLKSKKEKEKEKKEREKQRKKEQASRPIGSEWL